MNSQMHELLLTLDRAKLDTKQGEGWVSGHALRHIPRTIRNQAQTKQWMIGEGSTTLRKYKITTAGRTALANNAQANMQVMDKLENGFVPTGDPIDDLTIVEPAGILKSLVAPPPHAPQAAQKNIAIPSVNSVINHPLTPDPRARACVQAIDILAEDWPEVTDLVESLMKLNARKAGNHE